MCGGALVNLALRRLSRITTIPPLYIDVLDDAACSSLFFVRITTSRSTWKARNCTANVGVYARFGYMRG